MTKDNLVSDWAGRVSVDRRILSNPLYEEPYILKKWIRTHMIRNSHPILVISSELCVPWRVSYRHM